MAQLTQRGLVETIGPVETREYKDKTYSSRILIIEQPRFDPYSGEKLGSNFIKFEISREELMAELDKFSVGDKVDVEFIVRGAKYTRKDGNGEDVFTRLELRAIARADNSSATAAPASNARPLSTAAPIPAAAPAPAPAPVEEAPGDYDPDLGF